MIKHMRIFIQITILFIYTIFQNLNAQDLKFSYSVKPSNRSPFNLALYELSKKFEEQNFLRFSKSPKGELPFIHADEVLFSPVDKKLIFISTQIIAPTEKQFKILVDKDLILFHTESASIAFFGFNTLQVKELTKNLFKEKEVTFNPFDFFISSASAQSEIDCREKAKDDFGSIKALDQNISNSLISDKVRQCLVTAFEGMKNQMTSSYDFFMKLKDDPILLWQEIKKSFSELYKLATNFSAEVQSLFHSLTHLDINLKLDIACQASGELAAGAVTMLTGAGLAAGASKLLTTFLPKLTRLKRLLEQFNNYKIPADAARDSLSCAI